MRWQSCTKIIIPFGEQAPDLTWCPFCKHRYTTSNYKFFVFCTNCHYKISRYRSNNIIAVGTVYYKNWEVIHYPSGLTATTFCRKRNIFKKHRIQSSPKIELARLLNVIDLYEKLSK